MEHAIFDVQAINEQWTTPLINEKKALKNWLKLASEEYKKLYVAAPQDVQDAIEESAKYVNIQTQADADIFWLRTGLKKHDDSIIRRSLNEQYQINENATEISATSETARDLGYSMDYFKMLEDMAD
jgi:Tfp pilus assembly protein PilF